MNQSELLMLWCKQYIDKKLADFTPPEQEPPPTPFDEIYPVGSIYLSVSNTNPAALFGGTWEQIKDTFLLAAGDAYEAGTVGGEAEVTLTVDEMPEHEHKFNRQQWWTADTITGAETASIYTWRGGYSGTSRYYVGADGKYAPVGGSQPHNNMPPYLAVYVWQRTA